MHECCVFDNVGTCNLLGRTMLRRSETEDFGELGHMQMNLASAHEGWYECFTVATCYFCTCFARTKASLT